ncbi:MAG: helix-turn-helix transcriptional regulator, partial [Bacteroidales bacterium]|nr:helix-turn-helix transcriptional regulator [Bacteroidales bacterium]
QYIYKNNLYTAKIYLDSSLKISNEIDAKGIIKNNYYNYTLLYAIKSELGNMQKYSKLFWDISDTIINEQSSRLIAEMQTKYETEKKEQQIGMLNIKNKLNEAQLQVRTYWLLIFIIAFTLVVIFVIILFIQKRNLLFANRNLVRKNLEIVASERKIIDANAKLHPVITGDKKTLKENNENLTIKYSSSPLTDEQKQIIKKQIINYFNNSRSYLNTDYSINTLAKEIHISRTYISQVINEMFGQSFSAFRNEYRIKEARKIMSASPNFKYTIESVAEMVGYKSKTAFNNAFKKHVGVTPSFYLNYIKKEASLGTVHE